jgi:hypothetical protein
MIEMQDFGNGGKIWRCDICRHTVAHEITEYCPTCGCYVGDAEKAELERLRNDNAALREQLKGKVILDQEQVRIGVDSDGVLGLDLFDAIKCQLAALEAKENENGKE